MPIRTCVGCRATDEQPRLVRLVADGAGRVKIDGFRRQPGRGAYVHPERRCVEEMLKKGGLERSLKRNLVAVTHEALWSEIEKAGRDVIGKKGNEAK
jgi:predicted RNA-binding protein YlxR (DUF448 family)